MKEWQMHLGIQWKQQEVLDIHQGRTDMEVEQQELSFLG